MRVVVVAMAALLVVSGCRRGTDETPRDADAPGEEARAAAPAVTSATEPGPPPAPPLARSVRLEQAGWRFDVDSVTDAGGTRVDALVRPATVGAAPSRRSIELDDPLAEAFATDLDGDHAPELLLCTRSPGSSAEGDVRGWRFEADGSETVLALPALDADLAVGWRGRDQFGVQGAHLVRSFPLYRDEDDNASPSAGFVRVVRYRLGPSGLQVEDSALEPMDGTPQAEILAR
jgi:hypothetical protein